jgi:anaerobic selenocysteine-containing dehydrogenase
MATPGIESVEVQGAPPRSGQAEPMGGEVGADGSAGTAAPARPTPMRWPQPLPTATVPAPDSYSVRLVAGRRLYDGGVLVGACDALVPLVVPAVVRAHPHDLEKLGIGDGGPVRVRSARGEVVLEAVADGSVPRGVAGIDFNLDTVTSGTDGAHSSARSAAAALIDCRQAVVDVRMETP